MYKEGGIVKSQTKGVIVLVPKTTNPAKLEEYRPITLLNADIKLFAGILVHRMRAWMGDILHPSQYYGPRDDNILDADAALRETVAETE
jgi:hypothetical protein